MFGTNLITDTILIFVRFVFVLFVSFNQGLSVNLMCIWLIFWSDKWLTNYRRSREIFNHIQLELELEH